MSERIMYDVRIATAKCYRPEEPEIKKWAGSLVVAGFETEGEAKVYMEAVKSFLEEHANATLHKVQ